MSKQNVFRAMLGEKVHWGKHDYYAIKTYLHRWIGSRRCHKNSYVGMKGTLTFSILNFKKQSTAREL